MRGQLSICRMSVQLLLIAVCPLPAQPLLLASVTTVWRCRCGGGEAACASSAGAGAAERIPLAGAS